MKHSSGYLSNIENTRALVLRFLRHDGIYRSDWAKTICKPGAGPIASRRSARPRTRERDGRTAPTPSSTMSSGRLFLDRVGRHQSPSPLHRHDQINMHLRRPRPKQDISTLRGIGHFYFALTEGY